MEKTSLAQIAYWCNGVLSDGTNPDLMLNLVVIDSRKIVDNSLFVAIKGENNDGHDFVSDALSKQANCVALVSKDTKLNAPNLIYVPDTVLALGQIASKYRDQFTTVKIVAITGSHGKTTVKEMLKSICNREFGVEYVLATEGNLNNHLGVPLMLLRLESQHKVAIIEMGMNHVGEIDYLSKLTKPHIACVNNVHMAHAGFFKGLSDIAMAKGEVFHGLQTGGVACINIEIGELSSSWYDFLKTRNDITIYPFGKDKNTDTNCFIYNADDNGCMSILLNHTGTLPIKLNILGRHNQYNALGATTIAINLGCSQESIKYGLANYTGYKRRLEKKIAFNGALIIDDSYNAGPASVKAAIDAISNLPHPHWLIFADLKELGEFVIGVHEDMAIFMQNSGIDMLLTIGELAKITHDKFVGNKNHFATNQEVTDFCLHNLPQNATLLVKGSNSMNLDQIVNSIVLK